jgi:Rhamnan synthesis protein F
MQDGRMRLNFNDFSHSAESGPRYDSAVPRAGVPSLCLIFAHFDINGDVRSDTRDFLFACERSNIPVIFVSTRLTVSGRAKLPPSVDVVIRENIGYDFYSYRHGLFSALGFDLSETTRLEHTHWATAVNNSPIKKLVMMNSSILIGDPGPLIEIIHRSQQADVSGLTISKEFNCHIQSFFVSFNSATLAAAHFFHWWKEMIPINKRDAVIQKYEIGLTQWLLKNGNTIEAAFRPSASEVLKAAYMARRSGWLLNTKPLRKWKYINPTMFFWFALWRDYSIAKIELIEKNPYDFKLTRLFEDPLFVKYRPQWSSKAGLPNKT